MRSVKGKVMSERTVDLDGVGSGRLTSGNVDRETSAEDKSGLAERHHTVAGC